MSFFRAHPPPRLPPLTPMREILACSAEPGTWTLFFLPSVNRVVMRIKLHIKREKAEVAPPSCHLSTLKWFIVHCPSQPVALPWEGTLWLSRGQLGVINIQGSPSHRPQRGGVLISLPKHASGAQPTVRTDLSLYLVETSCV